MKTVTTRMLTLTVYLFIKTFYHSVYIVDMNVTAYSVRLRTDLRGAISRLSVWPSPGWYTVHIFSGALVPNGILPGAKFTLHPSRAFFYIGSVTAWHSSSERQPNYGVA